MASYSMLCEKREAEIKGTPPLQRAPPHFTGQATALHFALVPAYSFNHEDCPFPAMRQGPAAFFLGGIFCCIFDPLRRFFTLEVALSV